MGATGQDQLVEQTIAGNFRITEIIGSGAMGTIYKAEQISLGKTVVLKLLHRHLLGDPTLSKRFHREAKAASLLDQVNCIQVLDFGQTDDGQLYIAMEHIDGMDLAELLYEQFPLGPWRVVHILRQVCLALDEAHANGVLHRDLKPENIMVFDRRNAKDVTKVLDFGIAKLQDSAPSSDTFKTIAGVVCGTPEYMSPEQARGEKLDGRSDLYSLGILLYQMLTNELPFEADSALGVVTKHLGEIPKPPRELVPGVSPQLEGLCLKLLEKKRESRPQSALDVVAELDRVRRELEAGVVTPERTEVDLRPVMPSDLAQAGTADTIAAPALVTPSAPGRRAAVAAAPSPPTPGPAPQRSAQADPQLMMTARRLPTPTSQKTVPGSEPAPRSHPKQTSALRLYLLTVIVAAIVGLGIYLVYRFVVATPSSPENAPLESPALSAQAEPEQRSAVQDTGSVSYANSTRSSCRPMKM